MKVLAVRYAIPSRRITNDHVIANVRRETALYGDAAIVPRVEQRLLKLFEAAGTMERFALGEGEHAIDLVVDAARRALDDAGVSPEDVEFVMYVGVARAWVEPAMANAVQARLRLTRATSFDVVDGCMSWLRALQIAHAYLTLGTYRVGLLVNCESAFHRQVDWAVLREEDLEHQFASFTIGEAATATVVSASGQPDDCYFTFKNFPEHHDLCFIPLTTAGDFFPERSISEQAPMRLYSRSATLLAVAARKVVEEFRKDARLASHAYDVCVGHEATGKGSEVILKALGIPLEMYVRTHARFGNTVSACVPLGLSVAIDEGRLHRGDRVLLIVASAGLAVAFCTFTF
jgi:3-oxoacyl-[acyl-carrier-protein] synthase III